MSKPVQAVKPKTASGAVAKKNLKDLFDERDRTRPGSKEEEEAARKILESVFPETDAD